MSTIDLSQYDNDGRMSLEFRAHIRSWLHRYPKCRHCEGRLGKRFCMDCGKPRMVLPVLGRLFGQVLAADVAELRGEDPVIVPSWADPRAGKGKVGWLTDHPALTPDAPIDVWWSVHCDAAAGLEGWGLFDTGGETGHNDLELQCLDCPDPDTIRIFGSDQDAHRWVKLRASLGFELERRALLTLLMFCPEEYADVMSVDETGFIRMRPHEEDA
jgi:hypothetical protein